MKPITIAFSFIILLSEILTLYIEGNGTQPQKGFILFVGIITLISLTAQVYGNKN